jgi:hypothetical protein
MIVNKLKYKVSYLSSELLLKMVNGNRVGSFDREAETSGPDT